MNTYELVIIINPNLNKEELSKIVNKIECKVTEFAKIIYKKEIGIKQLAYEIKHNKKGNYFVYQFEMNKNSGNDEILELERLFRISDEIIKYIIVKLK